MKRPSHFSTIKRQYQSGSKARRELIGISNEALSKSKRAIFALHRDDKKQADKLISEAVSAFGALKKLFRKFPKLEEEGAYRAALEEYAEAVIFADFLKTGQISGADKLVKDPSIYLAGLSDATGEMVRYATRQVTLGNREVVSQVREVVSMVIEFMLDLDLTGYNRNKFDQAKKNFSRLEQMTYDLAIRDLG